MKSFDKNKKIFWLLIIISIICQAIITPFFIGDIQLMLNWIGIVFYGFFGYIGMKYFEQKAGFPSMMQGNISMREKITIPFLFGTIFAFAAIISDIINPTKIPQIAFPLSLPAWVPVAILDEMFWRLFLLTFLIWFISKKWLKNLSPKKIFWGVTLFESMIYLLIQFSLYSKMVGMITPFVVIQIIFISGGFIIVSCYLYKKSGFIAPVTFHLSQYLFYHGLYGGISTLW